MSILITQAKRMTAKNKFQSTKLLTKEEGQKDMKWILLDASGKTLGRLASEVTKILRGKHKPTFTPHIDSGDGVIIVNAEKVVVTGAKAAQKVYRHHTRAPGGMKEVSYETMMERKPDFILRNAVTKMMPRTRLSNAQLKRLRIIKGEEHGMDAQKPLKAAI